MRGERHWDLSWEGAAWRARARRPTSTD